jgi:hypothetical protein
MSKTILQGHDVTRIINLTDSGTDIAEKCQGCKGVEISRHSDPDLPLLAQEPHTCPYRYEVHDDETLCNCCESCEYECCQDI